MIGKLAQRQNNEQSFSKTHALPLNDKAKRFAGTRRIGGCGRGNYKIVAELYRITDEELEEARKMLRVLKGENIER